MDPRIHQNKKIPRFALFIHISHVKPKSQKKHPYALETMDYSKINRVFDGSHIFLKTSMFLCNPTNMLAFQRISAIILIVDEVRVFIKMTYPKRKKSSKTTFTDAGHQRFAELLARQIGSKSLLDVQDEITAHYGKQVITHTTIHRQLYCEHFPSSTTVQVLADYIGISFDKANAILSGTETSYVDIFPIKTANDLMEVLEKANLPTGELLRAVAAISTFIAHKGAIPLANACP